MSFSKAKLHRFNDIKPCAPSPALYNVRIKEKPKSTIPQSERFIEAQSPTVSETGSVYSAPCHFRTPTLPKRKKTTTSDKKSKPKELFAENVQLEALKEKIVECENKDAFIKDLSEQIEELKVKMNFLEEQKKQLDLDKCKFEEHVVLLKVEHENHVKELTEKYEVDICKATEEKNRIKDEMVLVRREYEQLKDTNRKEMEELKINGEKLHTLYSKSVEECNRLMTEKNKLLKQKEDELKEWDDKFIEIQMTHTLEIEKLKKEHQLEIQNIEFEMLKTMTELQKEKENAARKINEIEQIMDQEIRMLKKGFEDEKQEILLQSEAKLKQVEDSVQGAIKIQLEEQLKAVENTWKSRLENQEKESDAILKECQAISEYNIIQCELEKKQIQIHLTEKTKVLEAVQLKYDDVMQNYEELNKKFMALQSKLSNVVAELNETRRILEEQLTCKKIEIKKIAEEKRAYEITIKNSQMTIDVLMRRLINSDRDVEQLKKELSDNEEKMLEYETKCMQLTSDLKQAQTYNDELEMQYESAIKLNTSEIQQLKSDLVKKVEAYKMEVTLSSKKLVENNELAKEIFQQLREAHEVIHKLNIEIDHLNTINSQFKFEIDQSQNELEDYHIREMDWNNQKEKLENNVREVEHFLELKQGELDDLKEQLDNSGDSEYYKNKIMEYEKKLNDTRNINEKYVELSAKYDELLQKYEQVEMENIETKNKYMKLSKQLEMRDHSKERQNKQQEVYDKLLRKYEELEKENSLHKKKVAEQQSLKERLDKIEAERDVLLGNVEYLENELKEVSQKYADLAGHHNNKQKIKHLIDLKTKNEELIQTKMDLELKLRSQLKSMEKLKKENSDLKKCLRKSKPRPEDKENLGSPNRSLNSSRIESPFKERNN